MSIAEYAWELSFHPFFFFSLDQNYLVLPYVLELSSLGFLVTRAVPGLAPSRGAGLKSDQLLAGYSQTLCAAIALACLADNTVLWRRVAVFVFIFLFESTQNMLLRQGHWNVGAKALSMEALT